MYPLINTVQPTVVEPKGLTNVVSIALEVAGGGDQILNDNLSRFIGLLDTIKKMETITEAERLSATILYNAVISAVNSYHG